MHQNIEIALIKTQSRAFRTPDWAECLPSNRTINLNTQQEWPKGNSVNVLEWPSGPSHSLGLNPVKYFWRNLKMCICPHSTCQSLTGEDVRRRMADNCQMLKSLSHQTKKTWSCKGASAKYLVRYEYLCSALISVFFFIHLQSCDNSVFALSIWCMECRFMWEKK